MLISAVSTSVASVGWQELQAKLKGSCCVVGESKIIVHANYGCAMLFIYDVNNVTWNKVELPDNKSLTNLPSDFTYCVNVVDTCFFFNKTWNFYFLQFGAIDPFVFLSDQMLLMGKSGRS